MNKPLTPGDLAIVIKSATGKSIGKIVECIQIDGYFGEAKTPVWLVRSNSKIQTVGFGLVEDAHVLQTWLRRIPNEPLPDEELEVQKENINILVEVI